MIKHAAKQSRGVQLTVRNVPPRVAQALRTRARKENTSVNCLLVEALTQEAGGVEEGRTFDDLDWFAGTWEPDLAFDAAIVAQDQVDEGLWR
jgi:plasmid stability protein